MLQKGHTKEKAINIDELHYKKHLDVDHKTNRLSMKPKRLGEVFPRFVTPFHNHILVKKKNKIKLLLHPNLYSINTLVYNFLFVFLYLSILFLNARNVQLFYILYKFSQ